VAKFVEKPDAAAAADYIKAGYLWNSGNFMFRASVLMAYMFLENCLAAACRDPLSQPTNQWNTG
jgi:mannose-1-phosphate guanylyltransferase